MMVKDFNTRNQPQAFSQVEEQVHEPNSILIETFYGFVKDKVDAQILVEACIKGTYPTPDNLPNAVQGKSWLTHPPSFGAVKNYLGLLDPIINLPIVISGLVIRSGTVIVFPEKKDQTQMARWRDGGTWSASRISGPFLLYREIESTTKKQTSVNMGAGSMVQYLLPNTGPLKDHSINAQIEPSREEQLNDRFITTSLRPNTKMVEDGLAKRTISLDGSDGNRYRVISYFYPKNVEFLYSGSEAASRDGATDGEERLRTPSQIPEYQHLLQKIQSTQKRRKISSKESSNEADVAKTEGSSFNPTFSFARAAETAYSDSVSPSALHTHLQPFQLPSSISHTPPCPCGATRLIIANHLAYLSRDPQWIHSGVWLAPLWRHR